MSYNLTDYPADYVNYDGGPEVIRVMTALQVLATFFVGLRLGVRIHRHVRLGLDDWLIGAATLFVWAEYVAGYLIVKQGGVGLHLPVALMRKPNAVRNIYLNFWWGELVFFTALALIKWSILAMYYHIFPTRFMKWGYVVLGVMTGAWWIAVIFVTIFQCTPVYRMWDTEVEGSCINANVFYISTNGVPNIVMDGMILCLPMYEVYKLQVSRKFKVAIAGNFLLGAVVIAASIKKLVIMVNMYKLGSTDVTYYLAELSIWLIVEPSLGIISACLPILRPILTFILHYVGLTRNGSKTNTPGRNSLVTFGQSNGRNKRKGYTTTMSLENHDDSTERLGAWPEEQHGGKSTTTASAADAGVQLQDLPPTHPRFISVTTELEWKESRAQKDNVAV